jgi:hypothetical protein
VYRGGGGNGDGKANRARDWHGNSGRGWGEKGRTWDQWLQFEGPTMTIAIPIIIAGAVPAIISVEPDSLEGVSEMVL